jgi:hypothetical protein
MSLGLRQVAAECERRAAEFREKAQDTSSSFNPLHFLELEQHWLHLACVYYQAHGVIDALEGDPDTNVPKPGKYLNSSIHW